MNAPTENERALANLRHLYTQMVFGTVSNADQAKRIADGLLSPAIAKLEQAASRAPEAPVPQGWIDPNDKAQKQYLPHIGERVLFKHDGCVYLGKHTGGSFKAEYPLGKTFGTWDCKWMYPSALDARRAPVVPVPHGLKLVPVVPTSEMLGAADREHAARGLVSIALISYQAMLAAAPQPPEPAPVQLPDHAGVVVTSIGNYASVNAAPFVRKGEKLYTEQQVRELLAAHGIGEA